MIFSLGHSSPDPDSSLRRLTASGGSLQAVAAIAARIRRKSFISTFAVLNISAKNIERCLE
jgi:hypothetical protein